MERDVEKSKKAGAISREVLAKAPSLVKPGAKLLDVAETLEKLIMEKGGKPAFPVNLSRNEQAAHYTPSFDDATTFGEKDVVKIDLGVHIDGWICDTALTIDLSGEQGKLLEASQNALQNAISAAKPGVKTGELGSIIEKTIRDAGFKPIENLTGHSVERFSLHAGVSIPNVGRGGSHILQEGEIFAIEPFATNGEGSIHEGELVEIFRVDEARPVRMREARRVMDYAVKNFDSLPFAERWLYKNFKSKLLLRAALRELMAFGVLHPYPVLKENGNGLVSQFETTVVITKDGCEPFA